MWPLFYAVPDYEVVGTKAAPLWPRSTTKGKGEALGRERLQKRTGAP